METKDTQSIPHQEFTHTTTTTTTASAATNEEPQSQQLQQLPALQLHQTDTSSTVAQSDYEYSNMESSFSNPYLIPQIQPNNNNNNRNNYQQSVTPSNQPPPPSLQPPTTSSLPPAPPPLLSQYQHYSSHDDLTRVQNPPLELKQSHSVPSVPTVRTYFGQQQQQQPVSSDHLDQMHSVVTTQQQQQLQNQNHSFYTSTSTTTNNIPSTSSTTSTPSHTNQQLPFQVPTNIDVNQYPDMTTLVNSNANIVVPMVENRFVDHKVCSICGKRITRDMSRHMRTHQTESRFNCKFPKNQCRHKSGRFNRPYDFKKHLLNRHFKFDDPSIKRLHNLSDKLNHWGTCPCGLRFSGRDWLDEHILTEDPNKKCPFIE
ncbi:hypothetical protein G210_4062 [Candida maltosa Xu316]|uniref:Uncharacterized protein n=1 Tax=Candida maltosa (strain Xu316) TaxID=1245528 RepID=M3JSF5_CANMX|nr:hypothetical protein G210_4062 [Candida maltosa Xu316]